MPDPHDAQQDPSTQQAVGLVDVGLKACAAFGRDDLARRLRAARERLTDPVMRVLVVGEFKQGKSSLVNALLNADVCPVDDDVATSVPTVVGFAAEPAATAWHEPVDEDGEPTAEQVAIDRLDDYVSEVGNPDNEQRLRMVEVGLPRRLLQQGLCLVDTPGVGGLGSAHSAVTVATLPTADAVLLVTDASQELTEPEMRFLRQAHELCPSVAVVLTKTDLYPEWRKVAGLDRGHLDAHGFAAVEIIPVSSTLRLHALATKDAEVNEESGFARLVSLLRDEVVGAAEAVGVRTAANAVWQASRRLAAQFETERAALDDPEAAGRLQQELEEAQGRAERLRSEAARWQTTLNDGMADVNADIDHDLRGRTRTLLKEAEARIDAGDPTDWWDEFETWLAQRAAQEIADNYTLLVRRTDELALLVAEHFAAAEEDVEVGVDIETPMDVLADLAGPDPDFGDVPKGMKGKAAGVAARGFTAMRGSYGGFLMFRMIGGAIGLGAMNPAIIGMTLLMGRKTIRDEKKRQLAQRQQQAKTAVRKYVDEVCFQIGKDSRDTLRRVQRQLRDGFTERAEEIQRSVADRLQAVGDAAQADDAERQARLRSVDAELGRVRALGERALALAPDLATSAGASA